MSKPRVLLTNDDGPPDFKESPYVLGLYRHLTEELGWDVSVVLPSSQKSWIGKAYHIKDIIKGSYFYPRHDGKGETSAKPRPLKEGEIAQWILFDGTPATCANIALHNIFSGQIDLVISGPNLGRNTSAAFALSSGTVGAALSSSLSKIRSIALSYGTVLHPTPTTLFEPAHRLGAHIIHHLWNNWGKDMEGLRNGEVDLYSVNIPLVEDLLTPDGLKIYSTTMWRNSYGRLFKSLSANGNAEPGQMVRSAGPDSLDSTIPENGVPKPTPDDSADLWFKFSPDMKELITPSPSSLPVGSDGWAIYHGYVSVTPLRASFGEPLQEEIIDIQDRLWKMRL
ncbi:putative cytoplasm protein [Lyophyllum shimeji]|uniref:Cytoplasm protein n=1 Tax=Lyophyllum shimeji TaxID=47721 RepID=A0A9P3UK07_LYOSH|nr:putative cytoplasm protein [Lyophyllum shimeji]